MNMKRFSLAKIVAVALCVALLLPCWGAFAEEAEARTCDDFTYVVQEDGTAKITDYTGDASSLTVPETLDGYAVTTIGDQAFDQCKNLTEITLPGTLTAIGDWAFYGCDKLTEITLPDSLESIESNPFGGSGVQIIHVSPDHPLLAMKDGVLFSKADKRLICYPSGRTDSAYAVPEGILVIGDVAFGWCENLTEITLPDSVTTIGDDAFYSCENLAEIKLPGSLTAIGDDAFTWCKNLTEITLPDGLTAIGESAFYNCDSLTEITLPDSLTHIGDDAFFICDNLTSIIVGRDSYAEEYCIANDLPYSYADAND